MLLGCLGLLIATFFTTEIPPMIRAKIADTNEVRGSFVQTKIMPPTATASGRKYIAKGVYRIRPGVDFEWRTRVPFETTFYATPTNYVYSNEDETVRKALKDLPGFDRLPEGREPLEMAKGFFDAFDALYKEEGGRFFVKAKPKVRDLKRALSHIEAEGTTTNWTLRAFFPNGVSFAIDFTDE